MEISDTLRPVSNRMLIVKRFLSAFLVLLIILSGCSTGHKDDGNTVDNYYDAADQAELIVTGHFEEMEHTWNMARDLEDPSKESSSSYVEGRVYRFMIDEIFKGESISAEILVNQRYSDDYSGKTELDEFYIEPQADQKYLLFLTYDEMFKHYYGSFDPFIFNVEGTRVSPSFEKYELRKQLGEIELDTIRNYLQQ